MPRRPIRDVSLFVEIIGHGYPLLLMHGGPGADHWTLAPFHQLADQFTLVFYDHRCNGRSTGAPVGSMTWQNLTADADALRQSLGFERWAVLGHSFGGHVALEYALRFPDSLSHLVLLDTGGDARWSLENAPRVLAERGCSAGTVALARRWFNGQVEPRWFLPTLMRLGPAYDPYQSLRQVALAVIGGQWRTKMRPEALIFAGRQLLPGWTVMDRLGEITTPTLVMAGRDDFIFPPEHQAELAAGIPAARLRIIDRAGHNPQSERPAEVMQAVREFLGVTPESETDPSGRVAHRMPKARTLRVAAIQTPASPGVAAGLGRAAPLVRQAAAEGAELALLPELMAVRYIFTDEMWDSAEPSDGPTVAWLKDMARDSRIWLGSSFLEATGEDFYNTFVLVGPDGAEAGRVRKQTPAMYEPWFFRGATGSHVIRTELGVIGVGVCNDNHRSYLPRRLQQEDVDLVLMPHCWPLPTKASRAVSEADIGRWHRIQMETAPLYARSLGVPAVFVNKVGPYASPAPLHWLPGASGMILPGHATIADSDGTIRAQSGDAEGVVTATVTLDPARKIRTRPPTYGRYVYPAGIGGLLALPPAWVFGRVYALNPERRRRARHIAASAQASWTARSPRSGSSQRSPTKRPKS